MEDVIVFTAYLLLFSIALLKISQKKKLVINFKWLLAAFYFKLLLGCCYGYFFSRDMATADTWQYFNRGLTYLPTLKQHPLDFLKNMRDSHFISDGIGLNVFDMNSSISKFRYIMMEKLSTILSLLSGGRYYVNLIFYNVFVLWGAYYLFKFLISFNKKYASAYFLAIFFFPPFVFWTSGYHRDGLLFTALAFALYYFNLFVKKKQLTALLMAVFNVLLLLVMRSFWGLSFIMTALPWWGASIAKNKIKCCVFLGTFLCMICLFFLTSLSSKDTNLPLELAREQWAFLSLKGSSRMKLDTLHTTLVSYFSNAPRALSHMFIRPSIKEKNKSVLYLLAFVENIILILLLVLSAVYATIKKRNTDSPEMLQNWALLLLVAINYYVIAITVPFMGGIVRYRAPFELLMIVVLLQLLPADKVNKYTPDSLQIKY